MNRKTIIEYDHEAGTFTVQEIVEGKKAEYKTEHVWRVIQVVQNLVCSKIPNASYWDKEGEK